MRSMFKLLVAVACSFAFTPSLVAAGVPRVVVAEMFGAVW